LYLCRGTDHLVDTFKVFSLRQAASQYSSKDNRQFSHFISPDFGNSIKRWRPIAST
jgi:hypothetical protein